MKKIATVTWITYCNFGTYLQAYALQNIIHGLGYQSSVIDDSPIIRQSNSQQLGILTTLRHSLSRIVNFRAYKDYDRSAQLFDAFKSRHISVDSRALSIVSKDYDAFVVGSDQIWHPSLFNSFFYAAFTDKPKISYAPSLGSYQISDHVKDNYRRMLRNYAAISVREKQGAELLEQVLGCAIETVLDPTLLLTGQDWLKVSSVERPCAEPYILAYFLTYNKNYLQWTQNKARQMGKKLIMFSISNQMRKYADINYPAGPAEFISAIRQADFVITDSFHATVFSILFEREFVTCKRFKTGDVRNQNSRLENLFRLVRVDDRFIGESDLHHDHTFKKLDYSAIATCLAEERVHSLRYLTNALNNIWS